MNYILYAKEPDTSKFFAFGFFNNLEAATTCMKSWEGRNGDQGWQYKLLGPDDKFIDR